MHTKTKTNTEIPQTMGGTCKNEKLKQNLVQYFVDISISDKSALSLIMNLQSDKQTLSLKTSKFKNKELEIYLLQLQEQLETEKIDTQKQKEIQMENE